VAHGQKTVELYPRGSGVHISLGLAYVFRGQYEQAIQAVQKARTLAGDDPFYDCVLGYVYACQGRRDEASAIAENLERRRSDDYFSPTWLAILYGAIGELDRALALLDAALEERDSFLIAAKADPMFAPLRSDPRYAALVRRMGLDG
jgi:tetratricopeptide (TPR) repeat protein